jgi:hypothetical protein
MVPIGSAAVTRPLKACDTGGVREKIPRLPKHISTAIDVVEERQRYGPDEAADQIPGPPPGNGVSQPAAEEVRRFEGDHSSVGGQPRDHYLDDDEAQG